MKFLHWWAAALFVGLVTADSADAQVLFPCTLKHTNRELCGRVIDFTHNHGRDRRIWSKALCEKRDLYVYLPPNFDPCKRYRLGIFLHGASHDEQFFLKVVRMYDKAIACGDLAPMILAAPDGSFHGRPSWQCAATWFANTRGGKFEDFLMGDVWEFLFAKFPIRPEREAHALMGASMGGSAAFAHAIKHKDRIKTAVVFAPALNLRWVDCHGDQFGPFRPDCWGWRETTRPWEVIGRLNPLCRIRYHAIYGKAAGYGPEAIAELSRINPIEMMERHNLQPGELDLFISYGGKDEFNIAAHVESFLYEARRRGIEVGVAYDPNGTHDLATGARLFPCAVRWAAEKMAAYDAADLPAGR